MAEIKRFPRERILRDRIATSYDNLQKAAVESEVELGDILSCLADTPSWNIPKIVYLLIRTFKNTRRLREISAHMNDLHEMEYVIGYMEGRRKARMIREREMRETNEDE